LGLVFLGAIIHTFLAPKFMLVAHRLGHQYHTLEEQEKDASENTELLPTVIVGAAFMLLR
jgi:hypothetical protein